MSLECAYYYLLLFIKKIVVNITDFPAPFKIYKKNSHSLPCQNFRQKLLICSFLEEITEVPEGWNRKNLYESLFYKEIRDFTICIDGSMCE